MSLGDLGDQYGDFYAPRFEVDVGDGAFRDSGDLISSLDVSTTIDRASRFSFTLTNTFDRATAEFTDLDWDLFEAGAPVEISVGYASQLEPLLVGTVQSVRPEFPSDGSPTVSVSGYNLLQEMMQGTNSDSWDEATDSDVARDVASGYDFSEVDVEDTGLTHRNVVQDRVDDYTFLKGRADRNDFEIFAEGGTFRFRDSNEGSDPELTLTYGESLSSFSPEMNNAGQVGSVEVRHWDAKGKEEIVGSAEAGDAEGEKRVVRTPVRSREEADRIASSELNRETRRRVRGRGETLGLPALRIGETIRLEGLGERFTKTYYVEEVTHRIGSSGYTTSFEVGLPEDQT